MTVTHTLSARVVQNFVQAQFPALRKCAITAERMVKN